MRVEVVSTREVPSCHAAWTEIIENNAALESPFFRPEFAAIVGERREAFVAVVDDGRAFLPFHRQPFGVGKPIGNGISDYQGVIAREFGAWKVRELVQKAGLRAFQFNHVLNTQAQFAPYATGEHQSPRIVLRDIRVSRGLRENLANRRRKMEREMGPISFDLMSGRQEDFDRCLSWKRAQYRRTGIYDALALDWVRHSLNRFRESKDRHFSGVLSTLRAGDRLIAAHFGLRSNGILHYFLPSYDPDFGIYSPGMMLLLDIAERCPETGIDVIDLGRGAQDYKLRLANGAHSVFEGVLSVSSMASTIIRAHKGALQTRRVLKRRMAAFR